METEFERNSKRIDNFSREKTCFERKEEKSISIFDSFERRIRKKDSRKGSIIETADGGRFEQNFFPTAAEMASGGWGNFIASWKNVGRHYSPYRSLRETEK